MERKALEEQFAYLMELVENRRYRELRDQLNEMNEVDIATFLEEELPEDRIVPVFRMLHKDLAVEVFANLSPDVQEHIIQLVTDKELSVIMDELYVDDAVDMLEELPAHLVKRVLQSANPETRKLVNEFLKYGEDSAGSIMTAEFVDVKEKMTVADAIGHIKKTAVDKETVYTCFVTDTARHLIGVVSLKNIFLADDDAKIGDIMETDVIAARTTDDQEQVAQLFSKYDLLSVPVVDAENRLVGIVTIDDAVDVMEEEATEDFERMAAMLPSEKPYLKTGVFELARKRIPWLLFLMLSATVSGLILAHYEEAIAFIPALVSFVPMLTGSGGNAGSQSATMVIRGIALGEIEFRDIGRVLFKEFRVALIAGVAMVVVNAVRMQIMYPGDYLVIAVVSFSLFVAIVIAKAIGGCLPLIAKALNLDPAIMASSLITTLVDAVTLLIYFSIARQVFPIQM